MLAAVLLGSAGCSSGDENTPPTTCEFTEDCAQGYKCVDSKCVLRTDGDASVVDKSIVTVEDKGVLPDLKVADKSTLIDVPYAAASDLLAKDFIFSPSTIGVGQQPSQVSYTVCNQGPQPVSGSNMVRGTLYISKNDVVGDGDDKALCYNQFQLDLKAGGCHTYEPISLQYCTIPALTAGAYHVFTKVDHCNFTGITSCKSTLQDPNPANNATRAAGTIQIN